MLKIGIINGPNLNMLGKREQKIYGNITLEEINRKIKSFAKKEDIELTIKQSNFGERLLNLFSRILPRWMA